MIRVILSGGLGNQMFEYAAGRVLSLKLNQPMTLDLYALNKKTKAIKRNYELDVFDISPHISSSWKSKMLTKVFPLVEKNRKLFKKTFGYFRDQSAIIYQSEFEVLQGEIILHGHFQNEKYFEAYKDIILQDFTFKEALKGRNLEVANKITTSNSIAVHIRRGDYLTDKTFALCDRSYYQEAISKINKTTVAPYFFIFSQDFEWVKENINFGDNSVLFVDWNKGSDSYIDMQLMSLCQHNIIANSSFSWWAAWLNSNPRKQIYAPSIWFKDENRNRDLKDFYPSEWIIL